MRSFKAGTKFKLIVTNQLKTLLQMYEANEKKNLFFLF